MLVTYSYVVTIHICDQNCEKGSYTRIGVGAGPAGPVLAGPLLFKVKIKFHFC